MDIAKNIQRIGTQLSEDWREWLHSGSRTPPTLPSWIRAESPAQTLAAIIHAMDRPYYESDAFIDVLFGCAFDRELMHADDDEDMWDCEIESMSKLFYQHAPPELPRVL